MSKSRKTDLPDKIRQMINSPYLLSNAHPITVTLCGLGGTGSSVLSQLGRIHVSLIAKGSQGLMVTSVDGDYVTEANRGRQLFNENDIGKNKAVALTERINRFYGTPWQAIPEAFTLKCTRLDPFPGNIFISCVDDVATRQFIHNYLLNTNQKDYIGSINNIYWIDTGNTFDKGQIIMGSHQMQLRTVIDIYPDMKKHESKDKTPSCSLAEALDKQHLMINTLIAHATAELVWDITTKPLLDWIGAYININKQTPIIKIQP